MTPTTETLRPELTPLPDRIKALPVFRGYPVPWFVAWVDGEPEFRVADGRKWELAVKTSRCYVCGSKLGAYLAFVLGPMCGISRTTVEPACHRECALWSILNCPFLTRPHMTRRENDLPVDHEPQAGFGLKRNPGVALLWVARGFEIFNDDKGKPMLHVGVPVEIACFAEGRKATRAEIEESIAGGLPKLEEFAQLDGPPGVAALKMSVKQFEGLLVEHGCV
jgi:hypothetical protein